MNDAFGDLLNVGSAVSIAQDLNDGVSNFTRSASCVLEWHQMILTRRRLDVYGGVMSSQRFTLSHSHLRISRHGADCERDGLR